LHTKNAKTVSQIKESSLMFHTMVNEAILSSQGKEYWVGS